MKNVKMYIVILFVVFISASCSLVDKIKEKMSSKDDQKKEQTKEQDNDQDKEQSADNKEKTVENTSTDDINFYNKYIDAANKISEAGDGLHKSYLEVIPAPKSVKKGMFLVAIAYDFKVSDLERVIKENKRSFLDGGELSKLKAAGEMKQGIESSFKSLLDVLDGYYKAAKDVSDYYKNKNYENDPSKASDYDSALKEQYGKYKDAFDKFMGDLKKYKPKKKNRDPESISDPDEKSVAILMNAYENTLDAAEGFYDKFQKIDKNSDISGLKKEISDFENTYTTEKRNVESAPFTDKSKYLKYSYEDYFSKMASDFVAEANKFIDNASKSKMKENDFNRGYDDVVTKYNYMITAYNSSIQTVNTFRIY